MTDSLRVVLAQVNPVVGDVEGNLRSVIDHANRARDDLAADLVVFPELIICGYPPEDLLFHRGMRASIASALDTLRTELRGVAVLVGFPEYDGDSIYNAACVIRDGEILARYRKQRLPNYAVFDEKRYFHEGRESTVLELGGIRLGLTICEDVWGPEPVQAARAAGAEVVLTINASPYDTGSQSRREEAIAARVVEAGVPLIYLNLVGGQDELVFDGGSFAMDGDGTLLHRSPACAEHLHALDLVRGDAGVELEGGEVTPLKTLESSVYDALVLGTRDYLDKHGFPGVVMGLSGGIDSSLTLAIAVDALGPDRVHAVMMPSRYTAQMSIDDAAKQAAHLGVRHDVISIESIFQTVCAALAPVFGDRPEDATEENIQSRARGIILMALSNKLGSLLLTTGNKSEMAVGYATLYGDMAGGFAPIKDCSKTLVYRLARYRNTLSPAIPERVIERPPSAELREDQKDTDSLPPYDILDPILEAFIEEDCSVDQIVERGYDHTVVGRILGLVKQNEYKRRQAPPGVRVSGRAFGRDWRYPITSGFDVNGTRRQ